MNAAAPARSLPAPDWRRDLLAGVSVAMVLIPQGLAYAELAGLPPRMGLFAGALPLVAMALFASCPYLQIGPVALSSLLVLGALTPLAEPESAEYIGLAALLALVVGVLRAAIGLFRAGFVADLLSRGVVRGFVPAAAIVILSSQLPSVFGVPRLEGSILEKAATALGHPDLWRTEALALAGMTGLFVFGGRRLHPAFPGVLLAVILGVLWSHYSGYDGRTVASIDGVLFPPLQFDLPWRRLPDILVPGIIIALVGFTEAASVARTYSERDGMKWNANREFLGLGVANIVSAFTGGYPVAGSFARSAVNRMSGARHRRAGAFTGLTVLACLPIAFVFSPLPRAVLGAIVVLAIFGLLSPTPLRSLWKRSLSEFWVAVGTFTLTLVTAPRVEWAVLGGVVLSLLERAWSRRRRPPGQAADA